METYINIGNFARLIKDLDLLQQKIDNIANYYNVQDFDAGTAYMVDNEDVDMVIRVSNKLSYLQYASKDYYESDEWEYSVNIISYNEWLHTLPSQDSQEVKALKDNNHYIYLLKDDLSFALMTMCGDVADDYITLMDYSDIKEVNVYTADFLLNSVSSGINMDKFYQIPVNNPDHHTINDVFDFLKKEK